MPVPAVGSSLPSLARLYDDIGRDLGRSGNRADALAAVSRLAVSRVPGAQWASITEGMNGRFATVTATDERARVVDEIQYELGTGPCVDAILGDATFRTGDLAADERWPDFAARATGGYGVHSMLSFRLYLEGDARIAGMNLYSVRADAFDDAAVTTGTLVATHGALAILAAAARERAAQLQTALVNSREIGTAIGILMASHSIDTDQAFGLLRIASQGTNRKLADIATDVVDTGVLDLPTSQRRRSEGRSRAR